MKLLDDLCRLAKDIEDGSEHWHERNESETRRALIVPFIAALGYDANNPREVKEEFRVGNDYVDYAILHNARPAMLIEAKRANEDLTNWWNKLSDYFRDSDAKYAILTNGREYRFYTDLRIADRMDKYPFLNFDLRMDFHAHDEQDRKLLADLQWFTKEKFSPNHILSVARRQALIPIVRQEMCHPSRTLVAYFAERISESPSLSLTEASCFADSLAEAFRELSTIENRYRRVRATDVVEIQITAEYKRQRFSAILLLNETMERSGANVLFNGAEMNHQQATMMAVHSVDPEAKFVSGWEFWRFIDPDTIAEVPIRQLFFDAEMRKRLRSHNFRR